MKVVAVRPVKKISLWRKFLRHLEELEKYVTVNEDIKEAVIDATRKSFIQ